MLKIVLLDIPEDEAGFGEVVGIVGGTGINGCVGVGVVGVVGSVVGVPAAALICC